MKASSCCSFRKLSTGWKTLYFLSGRYSARRLESPLLSKILSELLPSTCVSVTFAVDDVSLVCLERSLSVGGQ